MIPVVVTACGIGRYTANLEDDYEIIDNIEYERKFIFDKFSRHGCSIKIIPACIFYSCKNIDNINEIIVNLLIKLTKIKFGYFDGGRDYERNPTQYEIKNKNKICYSGEISISKCLYEIFLSEINLKVDYFNYNKWNEFKINCYDEFKSTFMKFPEFHIYHITRRILEPLTQL